MRAPNVNRQQTSPVTYPRSTRGYQAEIGTSLKAGKVVPIFAETMLRQDNFKANLKINIEMLETKDLLANPTKCRISAYVVPFLAMERFEKSRDQFDRSYMGQPQVEGGDVVPFFDFHAMGAPGADKIYQYLGIHAPEGADVETSFRESYNLIQNLRLRNRSRDLELRELDDTSLAQAFWDLGRLKHLRPSFEQSVMEGEVPLNVVNARIAMSGLGISSQSFHTPNSPYDVYQTGDEAGAAVPNYWDSTDGRIVIQEDPDNAGFPGIFGEMEENGITVSLANIEQARKLRTFAKLRERYTGLSDDEADEYIIDMLMSGLRLHDHSLTQPILIKQKEMIFSQGKRYATDSGNLDDSAVSGYAGTSMTLRVPELDVGGVVMVVAECFPQQLFERQAHPYFNIKSAVDAVPEGRPQTFCLPEPVRDSLDPQKVDEVMNAQIDQSHSQMTSRFAFGPLNWQWSNGGPRLGGRFHADIATTTERQRFWADVSESPQLDVNFYMVPADLQTDIFINAGDPFELFCQGPVAFSGLTQFGGLLVEETGNYEKLKEQMDDERIDQEEV